MAWETRNTNLYYYRKVRDGARVRSAYVGTGELAQLIAQYEVHARMQRAVIQRQIHQPINDNAQQLSTFTSETRAAVRGLLHQLGYHQHKGTWRQRRVATNKDKPMSTDPIDQRPEIMRVLRATNHAEAPRADVEALRAFCLTEPTLVALGDMAARTVEQVIKTLPTTVLTRETTRAYLEQQRAALGYGAASTVEQLLIDQVVVSYAHLWFVEQQYTRVLHGTDNSEVAHDFWDRHLTSAQRRHLRAVEALARVRRLLGVPTVQVNIALGGGQQVNVVE